VFLTEFTTPYNIARMVWYVLVAILNRGKQRQSEWKNKRGITNIKDKQKGKYNRKAIPYYNIDFHDWINGWILLHIRFSPNTNTKPEIKLSEITQYLVFTKKFPFTWSRIGTVYLYHRSSFKISPVSTSTKVKTILT